MGSDPSLFTFTPSQRRHSGTRSLGLFLSRSFSLPNHCDCFSSFTVLGSPMCLIFSTVLACELLSYHGTQEKGSRILAVVPERWISCDGPLAFLQATQIIEMYQQFLLYIRDTLAEWNSIFICKIIYEVIQGMCTPPCEIYGFFPCWVTLPSNGRMQWEAGLALQCPF